MLDLLQRALVLHELDGSPAVTTGGRVVLLTGETDLEGALLHLAGRRHAEGAAAAWRQIAKASSSNATANRRFTRASTASS